MSTLDELETRLQSLLELHLIKHLPGYKVEDGIAQQLAATMRAHLKEESGKTYAPNLYVIIASPAVLAEWQIKPRFLKELANALQNAGKEAEFAFLTKPAVSTAADISLPPGELRIISSFSNESVSETQGMASKTPQDALPLVIPNNAFLIIGGTQIVPLNRSVMNIGRRLDNHIVIDDPRVSRAHAQLRFVKDRFVIFDLNSSGGTYVNGQRINQSVLYPGDVISLAGVSLVFGQDLPGDRGSNDGKTEPAPAISADRPTVIINKDDGLYK